MVKQMAYQDEVPADGQAQHFSADYAGHLCISMECSDTHGLSTCLGHVESGHSLYADDMTQAWMACGHSWAISAVKWEQHAPTSAARCYPLHQTACSCLGLSVSVCRQALDMCG